VPTFMEVCYGISLTHLWKMSVPYGVGPKA